MGAPDTKPPLLFAARIKIMERSEEGSESNIFVVVVVCFE
jgi:hypothetical protein